MDWERTVFDSGSIAYIDVQTKLPVALVTGSQERIY